MRTIPHGRIERAEELYLSSKTDRDIIKTLCAEFSVSKRQASNYLARARKRIAAMTPSTDVDAWRAKVSALLLHAYDLAEIGTEKGPQSSAMVAAASKLAEIHGAMAPQKIEHSGSMTTDPKALHERAAALVARVTGEADTGTTGEAERE
jgi:methylphosphotriester-DNA--protein-cysteine methyltransferase